MNPERFLKPDDVMELSVHGLGVQKQTVIEFAESTLSEIANNRSST